MLLFSPNNHMYFLMPVKTDVTIYFNTSQQLIAHTYPLVMLSPTHGQVTTPHPDVGLHSGLLHLKRTLVVPNGYDAVMVSFERLILSPEWDPIVCALTPYRIDYIDLSYVSRNGTKTQTRLCQSQQWSPEVLHTDSLSITSEYTPMVKPNVMAFKMHFSFHKISALPVKNRGLFNCRVNFYSTFSQHLDCNNRVECEDGSDETGRCPFSSDVCQGKLASGSKCFFAVFTHEADDRHTDDEEQSYADTDTLSRQCQRGGGTLAVIQSRAELDDVYMLLDFYYHCNHYRTGLVYRDIAMSTMYRQMWTGVDKSIVYTVFPLQGTKDFPMESYRSLEMKTPYLTMVPSHLVHLAVLLELFTTKAPVCGAVCQSIPVAVKRSIFLNNPLRPDFAAHTVVAVSTSSQRTLALTVCPKGHLTHVFFICYTNNVCGGTQSVDKCFFPTSVTASLKSNGSVDVVSPKDQIHYSTAMSPAVHGWREAARGNLFVYMFLCDDGNGTTHYINVCDRRQDCGDKSDESFCSYAPCHQFTCNNGQCIPFFVVCDRKSDCRHDDSDEVLCDRSFGHYFPFSPVIEVPDPSLIDYDGKGYFTHTAVNATDPCPFTHYRCYTPPHHCLPVYTRCNGFYDCAGREDENHCDDPQCPGYYRCHASSLCLHPDHLCDGWAQCPQGDDELLCEENLCPAGCLCQGLAFVCGHPFDVQHFPLKYLDGSGSHLTPADLLFNVELVYLSLRDCDLQSVSAVTLPHLRHLDLSHNQLHSVTMNVFLSLENLRSLSLAHNSLHALYSQQSTQKQNTLRHIDLSFTKLWSFNTEPLSYFLSLQRLNLSHSGVDMIPTGGFQHVPSLTVLDFAGCPVENFPPDVFQGLSKLQYVRADTFKLCCASILPANFDINFCWAPQDEISSCKDLVPTETYRVLLWLMSILSVFGNGFCLVFRLLVRRKSIKSSFNQFVSSLSVADFIMGVYLAMIGIADLWYRGLYLHYDAKWTRSAACRAAGFLSLLSNQVSTFTVVLITLDRFIVIRFPFSKVRFNRRSVAVAVVSSWIAGFVLAVIPLLPVTSHWQFYSHTGICIPLPITRSKFAGRSYSFGVVVVTNFVLFLLIGGGQAAIYRSVQQNAIDWGSTSESSGKDTASKLKMKKEATVARRLITVVVTDFLCWFPIGLCGILSSADISIPGEVIVAAAILILPLNSALNPFLYTLNLAMEIRRRAAQDRLRETLLRTLHSQLAVRTDCR